MAIIIKGLHNDQNPNFSKEEEILTQWINYFTDEFEKDLFSTEENSKDYSTLKYKMFDIIRLKYSETSKWIKIFMTPDNKFQYMSSELFNTQKNKNEFYWKSQIQKEEDIKKYIKIIKDSMRYFKE